MNQILSVKAELVQTYQDMVARLIHAIPLILVAVILLVVAFLAAKIIERILRAILQRTRFDTMLQKIGIDTVLQKLGLRQSINLFLPRLVYFLLLFLFLKTATDALGLIALSQALESFFSYLPNLISAILLIFLGTAAAQFAGKAISRAAEESGIEFASSLGGLASGLIFFIVGIMAISQLRVDTEIVRLVAACALLGLALAFGLSFGLGTREITRNMIAGFYARRIFNAGDEIEIRGERGILKAITPTQTIVTRNNRIFAVSNSVFLDEVVRQ